MADKPLHIQSEGGRERALCASIKLIVERLIGIIGREYLDHTLFWNADVLERKLADFQTYYNNHRTHSALSDSTPQDTARGIPNQNPRCITSAGEAIARDFTSSISPGTGETEK